MLERNYRPSTARNPRRKRTAEVANEQGPDVVMDRYLKMGTASTRTTRPRGMNTDVITAKRDRRHV